MFSSSRTTTSDTAFNISVLYRRHTKVILVLEDVTKSCVYLQLQDVSPRGFSRDH